VGVWGGWAFYSNSHSHTQALSRDGKEIIFDIHLSQYFVIISSLILVSLAKKSIRSKKSVWFLDITML
jgi:hypothetical protein